MTYHTSKNWANVNINRITGQMICTIFTLARHTTLRVNREQIVERCELFLCFWRSAMCIVCSTGSTNAPLIFMETLYIYPKLKTTIIWCYQLAI
nr:MAG TPA: hypothetical protein [Caudoviricetes sp.]